MRATRSTPIIARSLPARKAAPLPRAPGRVATVSTHRTACACEGNCPTCSSRRPRILIGRAHSRLEREAHAGTDRPTPVGEAPEAFREDRSSDLLTAVLGLSNAAPPEGPQAARLLRTLGVEAATVAGRAFFAPGARNRRGPQIAAHEAVHARQQARPSPGAIYIQAYDPPTGTQPFPVIEVAGQPMVNIPTGLPPGPAAEAAIARLESMAASGAGVREISRAALAETAALPGGAAVRAQFYQRATAVIRSVAGRGWIAIPYAGPGGSVVFLGKPEAGVAGYGAIIASDGTVATGAYAYAEVGVQNGQMQVNMSSWRIVAPAAPAAAASAAAPATASATADTAASQAARRPPPTSGAGQNLSAGRAAGMGRAIAMHVLIFVAMYLLERWHGARQRERLEAAWEAEVTPALEQRLTELGDAAWAAMLTDPFADRYARIEADVTYQGHPDLPGRPSGWEVHGARFAQATMVTRYDATSVRTTHEQVTTPWSDEPRISSEPGSLIAMTPLDTFERTDRFTTYEPLVPLDPRERIRLAVEAAVAQGRTFGSMLAGQRAWPVASLTALAAAYRQAATGNQALLDEAQARMAEIEARADAERRFGTSAYLAARSAFEAGLSARDAAARTHWSNDADRLNFVRAFVAVSSGVSREQALVYADELERRLPATDPSMLEILQFLQRGG